MAGYKSFIAGDVVTAPDVQGYLMNQARPYFASASARTSSGMTGADNVLSYQTDTGFDYGFFDAGSGTADWYPLHHYQLIFTASLASPSVGFQNLFNQVISGTNTYYRHFRIEFDISGTAGNVVSMQLTAGGVAVTTGYSAYGRDVTGAGDSARTTSTVSFLAHHYLQTTVSRATVFLSNPYLSTLNHSYYYYHLSNSQYTCSGGYVTGASNLDGFTLSATNTMGGVVRVYGYRSY